MTKLNQKGFTLIELMIVIAIIGILAAIAIPQFAAYRQRAGDAATQADIRNAATAMEAYFVDNGDYNVANTAALQAGDWGFTGESANVTITITGGVANYTITGTNTRGTAGRTYTLAGPGGTITFAP